MQIASTTRGQPFAFQMALWIHYQEKALRKEYVADLIFFDQIIMELKALDRLSGREEAQQLNYLKATGTKAGILINFGGHPKLEWKRLVY